MGKGSLGHNKCGNSNSNEFRSSEHTCHYPLACSIKSTLKDRKSGRQFDASFSSNVPNDQHVNRLQRVRRCDLGVDFRNALEMRMGRELTDDFPSTRPNKWMWKLAVRLYHLRFSFSSDMGTRRGELLGFWAAFSLVWVRPSEASEFLSLRVLLLPLLVAGVRIALGSFRGKSPSVERSLVFFTAVALVSGWAAGGGATGTSCTTALPHFFLWLGFGTLGTACKSIYATSTAPPWSIVNLGRFQASW